MVNPGRIACIFTPFLLSLACLVCLILVFAGGSSEHNNTLGPYYFAKIDLTEFTLASALANTGSASSTAALEGALRSAKQDLNIQDIYTIYLWNYCSWNGNDAYAFCSKRQAEFWFNPIEVWGLNNTGIDLDTLLPKDLKDGLHNYQVVSKYMFVFYVIALVATCLTLLVGVSALFSRWGSLFTTFIANAATAFTVVASIIATALFAILTRVMNSELNNFGIHASLGGPMLRATWFATVFALAAGCFWLFSVCCCSGRSPYHKDKRSDARRIRVEKTPYTYERVGSPYLGPRDNQAVPLKEFGINQQRTAYEPFRSQQV